METVIIRLANDLILASLLIRLEVSFHVVQHKKTRDERPVSMHQLTLFSGGSVSLNSSKIRTMSMVAMVREKRAGY